jgi:DNA-binding transcriptional LysR family regulator
MERRLGTVLVERQPGGLALTTAGEEACALGREWRSQITALERRIGQRDVTVAGVVRLTAPDAVSEYLLPEVIASLRQSEPSLQLELIVANQPLSLAQREADLALRVTAAPDDTLKGRQVGEVAMAVYAPQGLRLPRQPDPWRGLPWIGFDGALACQGPGAWMRDHVPDELICFRANTLLGAAQAVRSGVGCAVLPCFVGATLPQSQRISEPLPGLTQPLWLLAHAEVASRARVQRASRALASRILALAPRLSGAA